MGLSEYKKKRNFKKTTEPSGGKGTKDAPLFVVQEHHASHLHYDFRLEAFGVLKSWAVPKGPSVKVGDKRLAVEVEDHPIDYANFKGRIPEGEYGAGVVKIWDKGVWIPPHDLKKQFQDGHLEFEIKGKKLKGKWLLQRTKQTSGRKNQWLLIKRHDDKDKKPTPLKVPNKSKKPDAWPGFVSPQLALLVDEVPTGDQYIHEMKFDGYRTLAQVQGKSIQLVTRSGLDWTEKYKPLDQEIKKLKVKSAIFDGEIVALNEKGQSDFSALQNALKESDLSNVVYYVFDLLYLNGEDLRKKPLELRKQLLKKVIDAGSSKKIIFSTHLRGQGEELLAKATKEGLEGIVSKDRNQAYRSGRSDAWQKIKTSQRQELVIGGYTDPEGSRQGLGALLMGVYESTNKKTDKELRYVGRVGTGFNSTNIDDLMSKLEKLESAKTPFTKSSPHKTRKTHWVQPKLVAEIEFKAWTGDQILRHASFKGLREDKKAKEVVPEKAAHLKSDEKSKSLKKTKNAFHITHPERVIYPEDNIKKIDVANYYKSVAPWLLKHISGRPLSLLRCPDQAGEHCFFQKHIDITKMPDLKETLIRDQKVISVDSEEGLLQLVQWGVLEPHAWQCHIDNPLHPDQLVFDLDPDEGVPWKRIRETAFLLKDLLERLDLESFLKTTGGKGLHLQVPIAPLYTWEQIKNFAKTLCQQLESENPGEFTTNSLKKNRKNKIFLDYLRNGFGATAVAPFSLRSKEHPTVAMPLDWKELKDLKGAGAYDMHSALQRLAHQKKDPWARYFRLKQKIGILKHLP